MRVQRRDGKTVHFGTRRIAKGGYEVICKRHKLVAFADWKRTKKPIDCPVCLEKRAARKANKKRRSKAVT